MTELSATLPRTHESHRLEAVLLAIAFAAAHTQSPLYFSNQNQYFLHGLAASGHGHLSHDWLAGTTDPTPLFSFLVSFGYRHLGEWSFQAAYFLLLMGYFLSVRWFVSALPGMPETRGFRLLWAALFTATHAAILRVLSVDLTGVDYPWFFQAGVAGQYALGPGLQPSAFGVLLITSVAAFANRRPVLACGLAGLTCAFHSTYLLPAALFTIGYLIVMFRENDNAGPTALLAAVASSAVGAPVAGYTLFTFGPSDPVVFEAAQRILVEVRIPHHCNIDRWFDTVAGLQVVWMALGIVLLRRSHVHGALVAVAICSLVLTLLQYRNPNPTFALMFPWRVSVVLVPIATAAITATFAEIIPPGRKAESIAGSLIVLLTLAGVWVMVEARGYRTGVDERPLYEFVRTHSQPTDVYLLPAMFPKVGSGRGAMSASFTPPPRPKPGSNLIPVDLQRFRLHTGAAIYVDFKSIPYLDVEVLEWMRRMRQCQEWFAADWNAPGRLQELRQQRITHVVVPTDKPLSAEYLEIVYSDQSYVVYRLK
jgi:hypothetical protein